MSETPKGVKRANAVAVAMVALLAAGVIFLFVGQYIGEQRLKDAATPTDVTPTDVTPTDVTPTDVTPTEQSEV